MTSAVGTPFNEREPDEPRVVQRDIRALRAEMEALQQRAYEIARVVDSLDNRILILEARCE